MLNFAGHEVITAKNGEIGLELYRREPTDLVITDILMPEMGGIEFIVQVHKDDPSARIIAMTGAGSRGDLNYLEDASLMGAIQTRKKPFTLDELLETVGKALEANG